MREPYLRKITCLGVSVVWLVDGKYVRDHLDQEFTNYGQHYRFEFIPENEFWIDRERVPGEEFFYIEHMLVENELMSKGVSYEVAAAKADSDETRRRRRIDFWRRHMRIKKDKMQYVPQVRKALLKQYSGTIQVWMVDGHMLRDLIYVGFTEGGHDKIYSFIPAGEIWIDDDLSPGEVPLVVFHEIHERNLMAKGLSYTEAHVSASSGEHHFRTHPQELPKAISDELGLAEELETRASVPSK